MTGPDSIRFRFPIKEVRGLVRFLADCPGRLSAAYVPFFAVSYQLLDHLKTELPDLEFVQAPENLPDIEPALLAQMRNESTRRRSAVYVIPLDGRSPFSDDHGARVWFERLNFQREALAGGQGRTLFLLNSENRQWLTSVADDLNDWLRSFDLTDSHPIAEASDRDLESQIPSLVGMDSPSISGPWDYQTLILQARQAVDAGVAPLALLENHLMPWADAAVSRRDLTALRESLDLTSTALAKLETAVGNLPIDTLNRLKFFYLFRQGDAAMIEGKLTAAHRFFDQALNIASLQEPDNAQWQRCLSNSWNKIGAIRQGLGDLAQALDAYTQAKTISDRLAKRDPDNADLQRDLSVSWNNIGNVRQAQGDLIHALDAYTQQKSIADRLVQKEPDNSEWQRDLSISWNKIGAIRQAQGNLAQALEAYTQAKTIRDHLATKDPDNALWQRDLSVSWDRIGNIRQSQGDLAQALDAYTQAKTIRDRLAHKDPDNSEWQRDLSVSWNNIGTIIQAQGDLAQALYAYNQAKTIRDRLAQRDPDNSQWQRDLFVSHVKLGSLHEAAKDVTNCQESFRAALLVLRGMQARGMHLSPSDLKALVALEAKVGD